MPSETTIRSWSASYSDGTSAKGWPVKVALSDRGIMIDRGSDEDELVWPFGALKTDTPISRGAREALVSYEHMPGARLFVQDATFASELSRRAGHLSTAAHRWRWAKPVIALAALIIAGFALVWALELRPARTIAGTLPDTTRQAVGRNVITHFASRHKECRGEAGRRALDKLLARLLKDVANAEGYSLTVVNWGLVNAFAAPGGQMLLTRGLIRAAKTPEEVAGVLAHEIGHGVELHPETGLVRAIGLTALVELLTGGSSGTLSNLSAMALQNSYVRRDERAADQQALLLLQRAGISQLGLADFFTRLADKKKPSKKGLSGVALGTFDLLRTHPYPAERAKMVRSTARYPTTPALSPDEWQALRRICATRS